MIPQACLVPDLVGTPVRVVMYAEGPREGVVVGLEDDGGAASARGVWLQVDVGGGRIVERGPSQCTALAREREGASSRAARAPSGTWTATG